MALWGITTTTETAANNYNIPKYLQNVDRNRTPHDCFADVRGWVKRNYKSIERSGLSTEYSDEVLVAIAGLTTTGGYNVSLGTTNTGLGVATPVAVFFMDPANASQPAAGLGGTTGISTGATGYVHVVFNELVFAGAGATVSIRSFDANEAVENSRIVAYATSVTPGAPVANYTTPGAGLTLYRNYNGQITNRVAFAFTAPSSVLTANVPFLTTATSSGQTVGIGSTVIWVDSVANVSVGSSLTITGKLINVPIVSVGNTFVFIGTGSTIGSTITAGLAATFSTRTNATILKIDMDRGFVGVITDIFNGVGVTSSFSSDIIRNVGGAGTFRSVSNDGLRTPIGLGTTALTVKP